jgi:hypothetical protein
LQALPPAATGLERVTRLKASTANTLARTAELQSFNALLSEAALGLWIVCMFKGPRDHPNSKKQKKELEEGP